MKKIILLLASVLFILSCGSKQQMTEAEDDTKSTEQEQQDRTPASESDAVIVYEDVDYEIPKKSSPVYSVEVPEDISIEQTVESPVIVFEETENPSEEMMIVVDSVSYQIADVEEQGRLVYEIPSEMVKFQTYTVEVRIAQNEFNEQIVRDIQPVVDTIIRTSETMQVELVDPTDVSFRIVSQSAQQLVEPTEFTTWVFYVTPLVHGQNYISVVVSIMKDGNLKQTVYKDNVLVNTSTWIEVTNFVSNYWQWIIGFLVTVAIPFIIWLVKYFKKRKNNQE